MTILASDRISLRPPSCEDSTAILAVVSDPSIAAYFERIPYPVMLADLAWMFEEKAAQCFLIERCADAQVLGAVNLHRNTGTGDYISYWLGTAFRGFGYGAEAVTLALDYCFEDLGLPDLLATVHDGNAPSHGLMQRLDFRLLRRADLKGRPGSLYQMTRRHWRAK